MLNPRIDRSPVSRTAGFVTAAVLVLLTIPLAGLTVGWPDEHREVTLRLPPSVVVHTNTYDDQNLDEEIYNYDRRRNEAFPIPLHGHMHNDLYGPADFYGWSEHVARRLSRPEGRETLRAFLEARGFLLS